MTSAARPGGQADERTQLVGWLGLNRAVVHQKCADLTDEQAHRVVVPTSPLLTVAGMLSHLRWVEHCWFQVVMLDRPSDQNPQFQDDVDEDEDFIVPGRRLEDLLREYEAECAASDAVAAALSLDDVARHPRDGKGRNLRWILLHMLEETARHAGHLDLIRESLDGRKSYF